jgi:CheY-like chemotaxis protein
VLEAADGRTGLRLAEQERPDIILLDLAMPEVTGVEVIRRLGERVPAAGIPVLVMSAFLDVIPLRDRERVAGVLPKPIDVSDLLAAIKRALEPSHDRRTG